MDRDDSPLRSRLGARVEPSLRTDEPRPEHAWDILQADEGTAQPSASVRGIVKDLLETAIFILLVFFIVRGVIQNFKIEGQSMEPNLHGNQYILVNKLVYFHFDLNAPLRLLPGREDLPPRVIYPFHMPRRGDVVVFEYPRDPAKDFIKRVIGLPGDTVEIKEGRVFVNNTLLDEPYINSTTVCQPARPCFSGPVVVPPGTIFVMGDNRTNSSDSRDWDALPLNYVIGQAWVSYWPQETWGVIDHPTYAADLEAN
jgi:signal peptidase I